MGGGGQAWSASGTMMVPLAVLDNLVLTTLAMFGL